MKIKASNSAIDNNMLLGFWLVVFATLVLLTTWLFRIPSDRTDKLIARLADTDKNIASLKAIHAEFLLLFDKEDSPFVSTGSQTEDKARLLTASIKIQIEYLNNYKQVSRKPGVKKSLDELSIMVSEIEAELDNLFFITNERGTRNSGIVSQWLGISKRMLAVPDLKDDRIVQLLIQIKQLESEYLISRDLRTLTSISSAVEEIRNQITTEESAINLGDVDAYMVLTANLASIEKRMGHNSEQGIVPDLKHSLDTLPVLFENTRNLIESGISGIKRRWAIAYYLVIAMLVAGFITLFVRVFSLAGPLKQISGFALRMADGEFPDESIAAANSPEVLTIKESLAKHIASLHAKLAFTQLMNQDQFDTKLSVASNRDLLGNELIQLQQKIVETAEKQARNEEDNLKRRYMNEGLARFGDILRSQSNDFSILGDNFIREMVKYLNAIQGGFFILDTTEKLAPALNLVSAFAFDRKKYLQQSIALGEGLVGTCAREKQTINITEIPPGYIFITSGLGDTPPNNILLLPVLHENEVLGVIEIASLNKFKDHEIEFAEEVAQSLGSTIVYTRNNQQTVELLSKSQQQALEMAEQEEEMRQNMEELKATQEESNRREEAFRGIAEAVGKAFLVIEYDLTGIIIEANEKCSIFFGLDKEEIIGKSHLEVFKGTIKPDPVFWEEIQKNGHLNLTENIMVGKKSFIMTEHFTPVMNRDNIIVKFINFATDGRIGNS
jgi:PAS domain-containing protein